MSSSAFYRSLVRPPAHSLCESQARTSSNYLSGKIFLRVCYEWYTSVKQFIRMCYLSYDSSWIEITKDSPPPVSAQS